MPVLESVLRYLPLAEQSQWPPKPDSTLAHHTPKFNTADDWNRISHYSRMFTPGTTLAEFIVGSQLSQAVGVRHTLERARTRRPDCSGALYYKMNDNYPAASWSCVDWYGAPKIGHYVFQDAFAPLHACVVPTSLDCEGKELSLPVFLLDDAGALKGAKWQVEVRAYNGSLRLLGSQRFEGKGPIKGVQNLGDFGLGAVQTKTNPLFIVTEVMRNGLLVDRTFAIFNFEKVSGCLFRLPETVVSMVVVDGKAVLKNEGHLPAVGVSIVRPGHADTFTAGDGFMWLEPGETKSVGVNASERLSLEGLNVRPRK
jgi:beta-mannosidase